MSNPYAIPLSWRNMALVIVGGVTLWVVPWLSWPLEPGRGARRPPPVFKYIRVTQGLDGSAWSPVLMPVPTPYGFSKKAALSELPNKSLVSVLKPKISSPAYIPMEPTGGGTSCVPNMTFLRPVEFDPEVSARPDSGILALPAASVFRFEIPENLRYRQYEVEPISLVLTNGHEMTALSAVAAVEIDKQGWIRHVMLEQPAGVPQVDSAIVRGLRAGRGQPGPSNIWGRVKFFYWKTSPVQKE